MKVNVPALSSALRTRSVPPRTRDEDGHPPFFLSISELATRD